MYGMLMKKMKHTMKDEVEMNSQNHHPVPHQPKQTAEFTKEFDDSGDSGEMKLQNSVHSD